MSKLPEKHPAIVVPNWNGELLLSKFLENISKQTRKHTLIVVDNASIDRSVEIIKNYPNVVLLKNQKNLGFSGGVNAGIKWALKNNFKYIALLNSDALPKADWLENLVDSLNKNNAKIVTSKIIKTTSEMFDTAGDQYTIWGLPFPRGRNEKDIGQYQNTEEVTAACAGASLYSRSVFEKVGLFDENFFMYFEDVDISLRAQLAGLKIIYEPKAIVYHEIGWSSRKMPKKILFHTTKNLSYLYIKNMPSLLFWRYLPYFSVSLLSRLIASIKHGWIGIWLLAQINVLLALPRLMLLRWRIQKNSTVTTSYFNSLLGRDLPPTEKSLLKIIKKRKTL